MARILMVDDDPMLHRIMNYMLRKDNHVYLGAYTLAQALERLEEEPVDMVIVDLMMPGDNGMDVLERLRADWRYCQLPIIMLTASGHEYHRLMATEKGVTAFLQKPTSSRELTKTINQALDHQGQSVSSSM